MEFPAPENQLSARRAGLISCHACDLLCRRPSAEYGAGKCPRCGARLHGRKPHSIARTWALILTAYICYIPANLLPITYVTSLGKVQSDTILSGVIYFIYSGMWPIALVIFVASVFVPLLKLILLTYLLFSVQRRSVWRPRERTRLYRITEAVGRWSMVDIFVITVLVALVQMGNLAEIKSGPAAPFFGAVVIVTMIAAMTFDPRLIWDGWESARHERNTRV
ncbi:MAG: paraquat-inducible protein A [Desulfobacterales bacterium]